ncbi:hypothetical protein HJG44_04395 [Enterovirga sp. DB1703]|uniref:Magnesium transporter MgtE intracellular domain-containing protein n=1 Tax=Enterovirga aerilata TaxID=2730920 RepID=A0A849I6H0_9HYPH|nr:hypothetical protein [Enterovirga sp. DB1703]
MDGVVIAAVALLGLKVLGVFAELGASPPADARAAIPAARQSGFARVISHARTNHDSDEPMTTGSVPSKEEPAQARDEPQPAAREAAPPLQPPSPTERLLLERLSERREELQQRSREMEAREKLIQEQERRLEERLGQMRAAEEAQKAAPPPAKPGADPGALKNVVIMYETMKPKEAARVFDRLPLDVLLSVVTQMNSRKMAEILAVMTPDVAEKLTVALAKRAAGADEPKTAAAAAALPAGELPAIERPGPARR